MWHFLTDQVYFNDFKIKYRKFDRNKLVSSGEAETQGSYS